MLKVLFHPVTIFNLLLVGFLGLIEVVHINAHREMEADVHGYVTNYCRKNREKCEGFLRDD